MAKRAQKKPPFNGRSWRYEIVQGKDGLYYWHKKSRNGKVFCTGGQGFVYAGEAADACQTDYRNTKNAPEMAVVRIGA